MIIELKFRHAKKIVEYLERELDDLITAHTMYNEFGSALKAGREVLDRVHILEEMECNDFELRNDADYYRTMYFEYLDDEFNDWYKETGKELDTDEYLFDDDEYTYYSLIDRESVTREQLIETWISTDGNTGGGFTAFYIWLESAINFGDLTIVRKDEIEELEQRVNS